MAKPILLSYFPFDANEYLDHIREALISATDSEYHVITVSMDIKEPRFEALLATEEINIDQLQERVNEIVKNGINESKQITG